MKNLIAFVLSLALFVAAVPSTFVAQQPTAATATDYTTALAAIEKSLEEKRKELGIPGMSLVIVKDDKVIYLKGLGVKDFEKNIPVTPDTRFAIGSASKAFTASSLPPRPTSSTAASTRSCTNSHPAASVLNSK